MDNFDLGDLKNVQIDTASINRFSAQPTLEAQIERYGRVDGMLIGIGGEKSQQYKRYEKLKLYSEERLIQLANFKSPIVQAYAFDILTERNSKFALEIFKAHLNDSANIEVRSGCFSSTLPLNEYFYTSIEKTLSKEDRERYSYLADKDKFW
ncbi:MAG: hypothetical protein ABL872_10875 [Lacibacter sp.]